MQHAPVVPDDEVSYLPGVPGDALGARGAMQANGEAAVSIVLNVTGHIKEFDPGSFEAGSITEAAFTMGLRYYRLEVAGATVHEVDVENMTRVINGADQLASIRNAIGI